MPKLGNRIVLTPRRLERLRHPGGSKKLIVFDDPRGPRGVRGFGVRLFPSGHRPFVVKLPLGGGRYRLETIGTVEEMSLDDARREAARRLLEARAGRLRSVRVPKLREFVPRFLAEYRTKGKGRLAGSCGPWRLHLVRLVEFEHGGSLGDQRLDQIQTNAVQHFVDAQPVGSRAAVKSHVRTLFEHAALCGAVPRSFRNPVDGVRAMRHEHEARPKGCKKRQLTDDEVALAFVDADRSKNALLGHYVRLLADTGARPGELARARWEDVNRVAGTITIRDPKKRADIMLVVTDLGRGVLALLHEFTGDTPWLFAHGSGSYLSGMALRKTWESVRSDKTVALKHFRSTSGTREFLRAAAEAAAKKLGHAGTDVTLRNYVDLTADQQRQLHAHGTY